jgi:HlyD family secretion protein
MRILMRILLPLAVLIGIGAATRAPLFDYWKQRNQPQFRFEEITRGPIRVTRTATGRVEPKLKVQIGAFVSGPIIELKADFNDVVRKGDLLARIDPAIYLAAVRRDEAALATAQAEVRRVEALLQQARNNERRGFALYERDQDFISDTELDSLRFNRMSLEAQLSLAESSVEQAQANLENSRANLEYTHIKAPGDGMVIDRKIDPGQTLAAQFQTPELFVLGVDMDQEMYIYASVDEANIGMIRKAQQNNQPVQFRVDAYREEVFTGQIKEIRMSSTETQTVITYPVVVTAPNADMKLLPGMTAYLTFQVEELADVVRVPWSALRYFPNKLELVREADRPLIEGRQDQEEQEDELADAGDPTVAEVMEERLKHRRHVWVVEGDKLKAIEVRLGSDDRKYVELLDGDLPVGTQVVVGIKDRRSKG